MEPQIQYVKTSDGVSIAYYAIGSGPPLIQLSPGSFTNIEDEWDIPAQQGRLRATASLFTCIRYDLRGCGLSDRDVTDLSLQAMTRDLEAVVDRAAPGTCAIGGPGYTAAVAVAYAAAYPERVSHLVLWAPVGPTKVESLDRLVQLARTDWRLASDSYISAVDDWSSPEDARRWAAMMRNGVSPETYLRYEAERAVWDVEDLAPRVQARTLVMHPRDHRYFSAEFPRRLAAAIPGARLALPEGATVLTPGPQALATMAQFLSELSGVIPEERRERGQPTGMTAILFADIVDSTALTEEVGDEAFRQKARGLDDALRKIIRDTDGTPVEGKLLGDGVLSVFSSAKNAIDAAMRFGEAGESVGLQLHLGIHAGDVIREEDNVFGGAVNIAARISSESEAGEVLVSQTVRDLARTSAGVKFDDRGERELKGVGEPVRLYAVGEAGE